MCFFLYKLEKLYHHNRDGGNGNLVAAFLDTKALFVNFIYRYRFGAFTFEHPILKGPAESN